MELTDKFSWRRVWMLWRLYLPSLRNQLWAFPLVSLCLTSVSVIAILIAPDFTPPAFTFTVGVTIMFYFAPIALARRDYRPLSDQLPVLPSEKIVFLVIYFLIVVMVITTGVQTFVYWLSSLIFPKFANQMQELYSMALTIYPNKPALFMGNILGMALPSLTLMGVVLAKRNRILKGVLLCLGAYLAICTISGVLGGVLAVVKFKDLALGPELSENIGPNADFMVAAMCDIIGIIMWVVTIFSLACLAISWTLIYKKVKRGGF